MSWLDDITFGVDSVSGNLSVTDPGVGSVVLPGTSKPASQIAQQQKTQMLILVAITIVVILYVK